MTAGSSGTPRNVCSLTNRSSDEFTDSVTTDELPSTVTVARLISGRTTRCAVAGLEPAVDGLGTGMAAGATTPGDDFIARYCTSVIVTTACPPAAKHCTVDKSKTGLSQCYAIEMWMALELTGR